MQETNQETLQLFEGQCVRTQEETETGLQEGTIQGGCHRYQCKYTLHRHTYEPYDILITKSYGHYNSTQERTDYGNSC
jgi:Fe-S cluster assembly iron-binding protein IscA